MAFLPPELLSLLLPAGSLLLLHLYLNGGGRRTGGRILFTAFAAGAFAVVPAALFELAVRGIRSVPPPDTRGFAVRTAFTLLLVALPEETSKYFFTRWTLRRAPAGTGTAVGMALGIGFSFIENFLYLGPGSGFLLRSFTALPLHAAAGGLIGQAAMPGGERKPSWFFLAVGLHGLYDILLSLGNILSLLGPLAALTVLTVILRLAKISRNSLR